MSRSGYSDDCENWDLIRWRGQVASATRGARGQKLLRDLLAALDAMPVKRLVAGEFEEHGDVCALGALARVRGMDMAKLDPESPGRVAKEFDIARPLAAEIMFENDQDHYWFTSTETPEGRWQRMRKWVAEQIRAAPNEEGR